MALHGAPLPSEARGRHSGKEHPCAWAVDAVQRVEGWAETWHAGPQQHPRATEAGSAVPSE